MNDHAPLIEGAFGDAPEECSYTVGRVEGEVPRFVRGTYYLNGPARFSRAGLRYRHWLDGDGMVCSLRFGDGGVRFAARFVLGEKLKAEAAAGRALFRSFGTAFESDRLKRGIMLESPLNVSVYTYAGRLLAFGEQGLPVELDPETLETRGTFNFGGALNDVSPFSAHPKFDPATGEMFNFGVAFSAAGPYMNFYRFGPGADLRMRRRVPLEHASTVHDFGLSPTYAVFYVSPYLLDVRSFTEGGASLLDALRWEPELGSRLLVVSRETGETRAVLGVGPRYCLHFVNCFEEGGRLTVDVLELDRPVYDEYRVVPDLFTNVCGGRPVRFVIDVENQELLKTCAIDYGLAPDFPSTDPALYTRPYEDFWMLGISATGREGRKFFDQLVRAGWRGALDVYQAPRLHYLGGEPVFIAGPGGGGVVVCQIFDAARRESSFAVFDAFDVAAGPVARLRLDAPIHFGFHASFEPERARGRRAQTT